MNTCSSTIGFTNGAAKRTIARMVAASNLDGIRAFQAHSSERVRRLAKVALGRVAHVAAPTSERAPIAAPIAALKRTFGAPADAPADSIAMVIAETIAADPPAVAAMPDPLEVLADTFGENLSDVRRIFAEKGEDMAATKRSLVSRKSARTRAAAKVSAAN
jgi:hypothetical protein